MVCRFYFDIEVIRIIVFVTHSLVIKTIRYDQPPSLESELEIRSAPHARGGTPIHYLYGYVPPKGVVILKLLI